MPNETAARNSCQSLNRAAIPFHCPLLTITVRYKPPRYPGDTKSIIPFQYPRRPGVLGNLASLFPEGINEVQG